MTLYARMKLLAFQQADLRDFFGDTFSAFRWFYIQAPEGIIGKQTCARVITVSQITTNFHGAMNNPLHQDRVQIDVIDKNPGRAAAAAAAIDAWLETADFVKNSAFASPPGNWAGTNVKLNERGSLDPQTQRPIPILSLDYRIFNVTS